MSMLADMYDIIRRKCIGGNLPDASAIQAKEMLDRIVKLAGFDSYELYNYDIMLYKNGEKCPVIASNSPEGIIYNYFCMNGPTCRLNHKNVLQSMEKLSMTGMNIIAIDASTHEHNRCTLWPAFHTFDMMTIRLDMKDIDA